MANQNLVQTLTTLYQQDCKHRNRWATTNNYNCTAIIGHICTALDKNIPLTTQLVDGFYDYICKESYYDSTCIILDPKPILKILKRLIPQFPPSDKIIAKMTELSDYDECYDLLPVNSFVANLDIIIKSRLKFCDLVTGKPMDDMDLINTILKKIQITEPILKKLVSCRSNNLAIRIGAIIDKTSLKLSPTLLDEACSSLPFSKPIIASLISRGLSLNSKHLEIVCQTGPANEIDFIINSGKLKVDNTHFKAVINSTKYFVETDSYRIRKMGANTSSSTKIRKNMYVYTDNDYSQEKMEVLIRNGYHVTREDLFFSIKHKKEIPGIDRFNIKLDKELLEVCWDVDFYPRSYKFDCIGQNQIQLQELCKTRKSSEIKSLLKSDQSLVIDRKCMENVCSFAKNVMYDYLKTKGGVPTVKCIENVAKMVKNNTLLLQVIGDFDKVNSQEIKTYKNKIAELEKKLKEQSGQEPVEEEIIVVKPKGKTKVLIKPKVILKKSNKKNVVIIDDADEEKEKKEDDESEEEEDEEKEKEKEEKEDDEKEEKEDDLDKLNYIILPIDSEKVISMQKDFRNKKIPTSKMIKILGVAPKKKLSYSEVRNTLLTKIRDEGWIDKNNKNSIQIPVNVKKLLALKDKINIIQFQDIDKLVCLLY